MALLSTEAPFPPSVLSAFPLARKTAICSCYFSITNQRETLTIRASADCSSTKKEIERGLEFETGDSFFRRESAIGRDLGVLAASLYKKSKGRIRIFDAMCGCGIRSLRYLVQAEVDFVWANDANDEYRRTILSNLSQGVEEVSESERRWVVTHTDANRVMADCYLNRDFFDLIDVDSFGSDSSFFRSAYDALKLDGLLYVTSTDGYSSGGHRPHQWSCTRCFCAGLPCITTFLILFIPWTCVQSNASS